MHDRNEESEVRKVDERKGGDREAPGKSPLLLSALDRDVHPYGDWDRASWSMLLPSPSCQCYKGYNAIRG